MQDQILNSRSKNGQFLSHMTNIFSELKEWMMDGWNERMNDWWWNERMNDGWNDRIKANK